MNPSEIPNPQHAIYPPQHDQTEGLANGSIQSGVEWNADGTTTRQVVMEDGSLDVDAARDVVMKAHEENDAQRN